MNITQVQEDFIFFILEGRRKYGDNPKIFINMFKKGLLIPRGQGYEYQDADDKINAFLDKNNIPRSDNAYNGWYFKDDSRVTEIYNTQKTELFEEDDTCDFKRFYAKVPNPQNSDCPDVVYINSPHGHYSASIEPIDSAMYNTENLPGYAPMSRLKECFNLETKELEELIMKCAQKSLFEHLKREKEQKQQLKS